MNLISSSLSNKYCAYVHPSFSEIIKQMTPLDARNMVIFSKKSFYPICNYRIYYKDNSFDDYYKNIFLSNTEETRLVNQAVSVSSLERLGLIEVCFDMIIRNTKRTFSLLRILSWMIKKSQTCQRTRV